MERAARDDVTLSKGGKSPHFQLADYSAETLIIHIYVMANRDQKKTVAQFPIRAEHVRWLISAARSLCFFLRREK